MWSYHVLVFLPCLLLFCLITTDARVCQYKDFFTVQGTCRDQNKNLLEAEEAHNDKLLCKSLYELWYCVAGSVPVCLHNFTELYTRYMHSPHNCQLSHEQIIELQNLTHNVGDGEVDVEVDVQELTTQQPGSSSSSSSSSSSGDDGDGSTTAGDNVKGDTKGHTGSGATKLCYHRLPLIFISWLVAVRVTSFPLNS